jgi:hypothetical protein
MSLRWKFVVARLSTLTLTLCDGESAMAERLSKFQIVEHLHAALAGTSATLRIGARHNAA